MSSWIPRTLYKMIAPDPTKALALKARLKLLDLRNGMAVWFTPQEIEAVEQDRRELKREGWRALIGIPLIIVLAGWMVDFRVSWMIVSIAVGAFWFAMEILAWRHINHELSIMRDHETTAHRSFFDDNEKEGNA